MNEQGTIVDHLPVFVDDHAVGDAAGFHVADVARKNTIHDIDRGGSFDVILEQHRELHRRGRIAHRVIFGSRVTPGQRYGIAEYVNPFDYAVRIGSRERGLFKITHKWIPLEIAYQGLRIEPIIFLCCVE